MCEGHGVVMCILHHSQKLLQTIMANLSSVPRGPQAVPQEMDPTTGQSQDPKQTLGFCQVSLEL